MQMGALDVWPDTLVGVDANGRIAFVERSSERARLEAAFAPFFDASTAAFVDLGDRFVCAG